MSVTAANVLTTLRLLAAPALVPLAAAGRRDLFVAVLAALLLSDWLDGKVALLTNTTTTLGSRLDSIADVVTFTAAAVGLAWLEPLVVTRLAPLLVAVAVSWLAAMAASLLRFRRLASYHTYSAKLAWWLLAAGGLLLLITRMEWLLVVGLAATILANAEGVTITMLIGRPDADVRSVAEVLRGRRATRRLGVQPGTEAARSSAHPRSSGHGDDPQTPSRLRILHVSDLHFGPPYVERVGEALLDRAHQLSPGLVVVSGDLTQRARPEQFEDARRYLERLPDVPRIVVPGNHDLPVYRVLERLTNPYGNYRAHISDDLDSVLHMDGLVAVALDSTSPRRTITNGRIHVDQLELCERVFSDAPPDVLKILVAHHHFIPAPDWERDRAMPKAKRALDRLVELRVDMVFGGHLHRSYIGNSLDVYPGRERSHGIVIVQCGTSTSRRGRGREREKNSFNLVEVEGDMIQVTHFVYFDDRDGFAPVSRHLFPRPGRSFVEPAAADPRPGSRPLAG